MLTIDQAKKLKGRTMMGSGNQPLGTIHELYADRSDGDPTFATVQGTGSGYAFVPLAQAELRGDDVVVPYDAQLVASAPTLAEDTELSPQEEDRLYAHYGLAGAEPRTDAGVGTASAGAGHDTSGPNTDSAMTRSEEELEVGKVQREAGRVRLRKYVVTENVTQTVPVSREEVRVEREPITDANRGAAYDGPAISEEEHEVVLHAEEPVVQKEAVAVERVRLDKDTVTDQETVSEEVRKEQIEFEGDADTRR